MFRRLTAVGAARLLTTTTTTATMAVARPAVAPAALCCGQVRCAGTAVFADELSQERARDDLPVKPETPAGWTLAHTPGRSFFTLSKKVGADSVEIMSSFYLNKEAGEEGAEAREDSFVRVTIARGNKTAVIYHMDVSADDFVVDGVQYVEDFAAFSATSEEKREEFYPGPAFDTVDDGVEKALLDALEHYSVSDDLTKFIWDYSFFAEQSEYEGWLKGMDAMFSK